MTPASDLKERLQRDLTRARKDRDKLRVLVLSTVLSDLRNREIEIGREADDAEVRKVLSTAEKKRREAAEQMRAGGREELAAREEREGEMLREYLPAPFTDDEVRAMIREEIAAGAGAMGPLMGKIMPRIQGRFDGKEANRLVREELGS